MQTEHDDEKRTRMLELERTLVARQKDLDRLQAQHNALIAEHEASKSAAGPSPADEELKAEVARLKEQLASSNKCKQARRRCL